MMDIPSAQLAGDTTISDRNRPPQKPRLRFLDGLRGLAAFYVMLFHIRCEFRQGAPLHSLDSSFLRAITAWMSFGHLAVDIFIVLSGFCLMIAVIKEGTGRLPEGFRAFIFKRARRILPPYYAALILSFILAVSNQYASGQGDTRAYLAANFSAEAVLSHLFLLHNLWDRTSTLYDTPMWSVATEWQIYFLFPFLLLPIWRRFGNAVCIAGALAIGMAPYVIVNYGPLGGKEFHSLYYTCPWFLGLFAMGMASAAIALPKNDSTPPRRWGRLCVTLAICGLISTKTHGHDHYVWASDTLFGLSSACLIVHCARVSKSYAEDQIPMFLRVLESRPAVGLGVISYSLYLTHDLFVNYYAIYLQHAHIPLINTPIGVFVVCIVSSLILGTAFFSLVERHFLPVHYKRSERSVLQGDENPTAE